MRKIYKYVELGSVSEALENEQIVFYYPNPSKNTSGRPRDKKLNDALSDFEKGLCKMLVWREVEVEDDFDITKVSLNNAVSSDETTTDTSRALGAIRPLAQALGIDVRADSRHLYVDNTVIGISCNSTYATILEFIGWLYLKVWQHDRKYLYNNTRTSDDVKQAVATYWCKKYESAGVKEISAKKEA